MLLFVSLFAIGTGPYLPSYSQKYFPIGQVLKLWSTLCPHWVLNFLVGLMFLQLLDQVGPQWVYSMFCTCCFLAVVVKQNVMETKGKSLQEIEMALLPQD